MNYRNSETLLVVFGVAVALFIILGLFLAINLMSAAGFFSFMK